MSDADENKKAENSAENTKRGLPGHLEPHKWAPGFCPNPGGRPKRKPLTELYEQYLQDPNSRGDILKSIDKAVKKGQMAMVLQLREMAERVEGKVTQSHEISGEIHLTLSERLQKARSRKQEHNG